MGIAGLWIAAVSHIGLVVFFCWSKLSKWRSRTVVAQQIAEVDATELDWKAQRLQLVCSASSGRLNSPRSFSSTTCFRGGEALSSCSQDANDLGGEGGPFSPPMLRVVERRSSADKLLCLCGCIPWCCCDGNPGSAAGLAPTREGRT